MERIKSVSQWVAIITLCYFGSSVSLAYASDNCWPLFQLLLLDKEKGGCSVNEACSSSQYCSKLIGHCAGVGECEEKPLVCPDIWDPVCGCDGITYGNRCQAGEVGVTVNHSGECKTVPVLCESNSDCEAELYCSKPTGECRISGECVEKPVVCPEIWDPVCGCDNRTYGNRCQAAMAGVSVTYTGECMVEPIICMDNTECEASHYCDKTIGNCNGSGECLEKPLVCPDVWAPVCGCDDITYGNICQAAMAGESSISQGVCP